MAVYGYIRVSTAKQVAEDTPDTQRATIERLAMEHGLLVDRIFEDDAYTGNTAEPEQRPGFGELVGVIKPGDTIIMAQLNRIVRHGMVLQHIVSGWYRKNIRILVENDFDKEAVNDPMMLGAVCKLAEMKLKEVSATTKAGMARVARETDKERIAKGKNRIGRPAKNQWYDRQLIVDALAAGERPDAVAKRCGVHLATVYRIRKEAAAVA
ncbi:recombinase family protein [Salmonella enterica subsp. enterica serovar Infantis]|nr:recombinase family protein [Escherichia coli]EMB1224380.1 recombinase family protein [Salmonella enterica subsp. enterica serovar Infantis]